MANALFVLVALIAVSATAACLVRKRRTAAKGFASTLIPALFSCIALILVAAAPMLMFLAGRPVSEYQLIYYSALRWIVRLGLIASLASILWRCFQIGPRWAALGAALWALVVILLTSVAAYWLVAVQV
jgi:hypothetical protein